MTSEARPGEGSEGSENDDLSFDESAGAGTGAPGEALEALEAEHSPVTGSRSGPRPPMDEPRDYSGCRKWLVRGAICATLGAIGVGYSMFMDSLGSRVFNDEIDGAKVTYFEGITQGWKAVPFSTMNEMRVSKKLGEQDITYVFRDKDAYNPINFRQTAEQGFGNDSLEYVEVTDEDGLHPYNSSNSGSDTLDAVHTSRMITGSSTMYNDFRTKVRNELIRREKERMAGIESLVGIEQEEKK